MHVCVTFSRLYVVQACCDCVLRRYTDVCVSPHTGHTGVLKTTTQYYERPAFRLCDTEIHRLLLRPTPAPGTTVAVGSQRPDANTNFSSSPQHTQSNKARLFHLTKCWLAN